MNRLIATAFVFGMMVGAANAMPMTARACRQQRRHRSRRRMRPRLAPRPLWRLPPQLRPAVDARVPARLVSRSVRPLPSQRDLNFHHETILHHQRRIARSAVFTW
jgi:hypothetical protein